MSTPLREEAFDYLQAEREGQWLHDVFVEPSEFADMTKRSSIIVYGAGGSGKTAICSALARHAHGEESHAPRMLVVNWRPSPAAPHASGNQMSVAFLDAMETCAVALLRHIGSWPQSCREDQPLVREALASFVQCYVRQDWDILLDRLAEDTTADGASLQRTIVTTETRRERRLVELTTRPEQAISMLTYIVKRLDLAGAWVIIDGLESWLRSQTDQRAKTTEDLLLTLELFENAEFNLKIVAPLEFAAVLGQANATVTRRVEEFWLEWTDDQLVEIVQERLALVYGRPGLALADMCTSVRTVKERFRRNAGRSPRRWLEMARSLVRAYDQQIIPRRMSKKVWDDALRDAVPKLSKMPKLTIEAPKLSIDLATEEVRRGDSHITTLQPEGYKLLRYLYVNRHRLCRRSELFYLAHRGLEKEPRSSRDAGWEEPAEWRGVIDSALWRLRKDIEPDPKHPVYVVSEIGRGVRLSNAV